jgi:hypothetical protein
MYRQQVPPPPPAPCGIEEHQYPGHHQLDCLNHWDIDTYYGTVQLVPGPVSIDG